MSSEDENDDDVDGGWVEAVGGQSLSDEDDDDDDYDEDDDDSDDEGFDIGNDGDENADPLPVSATIAVTLQRVWRGGAAGTEGQEQEQEGRGHRGAGAGGERALPSRSAPVVCPPRCGSAAVVCGVLSSPVKQPLVIALPLLALPLPLLDLPLPLLDLPLLALLPQDSSWGVKDLKAYIAKHDGDCTGIVEKVTPANADHPQS